MREIKFRVWDGKEMVSDQLFNLTMNGTVLFDSGECGEEICDYPVMQYTGLKDKNGVEIYEGDIVTMSILCEPERGKGAYWLDKIFTVRYGEQGFLPYRLMESKVIGNIYQDAHLLEGL